MSTEQLALVADPPRLTPRQQAAYDLIAERHGATAGQIGAHWHELRGKHAATSRCDWCEQDGRDVVTSRALKPLVTYKRTPDGNLYVLRGTASDNLSHAAATDAETGYDPSTAPIPF